MTKKHSTKKALIASALSLVLCFSMLVGTTFAWFTDSVTSAGNIIRSGNLDVQLLMHNGTEYVDISDSEKPIFGEGSLIAEWEDVALLWEPGKTQVVYLGVKNAGSLALKYNILVDVTDGGLVGSLDYAIIDGATNDDAAAIASWNDILSVEGVQIGLIADGRTVAAENGALESDEYDYFALAIHMQESAGNEYKDKNVVIDINIVATQLSNEGDSFGNDYDANAEYPVVKIPQKNVKVTSVDELKAVLSEAANGAQEMIIDATGVTLEIKDNLISNGTAAAAEIPAGVTIKGATIKPAFARGGNYILMGAGANDRIVFENCIFDNAGNNFVIGSTVDGPTSVIYNNCEFIGQVITNFVDRPDGVAEFNGCTFTKATSGIYLKNFVEAMGGTHNFNNCTFDFTGVTQSSQGVLTSGCINVYSESEYSTTVVLNGCTRTNCGTRTYGPNSSLIIK